MASVGLNFTNITPDNGAVRDMAQVIMDNITAPERLGGIVNIMPRVNNGDKLALIGEFGLLGTASQGCKPTYGNDTIATNEKTWAMGEWEVAEGLCYTDLMSTFVKYLLRTKTDIADATSNEYIDGIIRPRLELAIEKMMFRFAMFGDTQAAVGTSAGDLKVAGTAPNFTLVDGWLKQLITIATNNAARRVTVAANTANSVAAQRTAILTAGVASGIFNNLILGATPTLRQASNQVIYTTLALKDALDYDLQQNNKGSELQWRSLFNGIQETTYQGIRVIALPLMDEILQNYFVGTGTGYYMPYTAIYTTSDNLLLGLGGDNDIADIRIWFDMTDQMNYILAKDKIGALVAFDDLVQIAY